jgi:hypothetical protein
LEKRMGDIMASLGEDALAYGTIRKHNLTKNTAVNIITGSKVEIPAAGCILALCDGRMRLADVAVVLGQKQTWSYSFCLRTMECIGCSQHANSQPFPLRGSNCRGGRQLIWATDQSMPPMLPTSSTQQCVKIMPLESGSLKELAEGLVRTLSGRQVAAGSVVLMTSASNMTAVGTAGYTEDLVEAIKFLRSNLGDHLLYGPLPNLLLNGCEDPITIRSCIEVGRWAAIAFRDNSVLLGRSFALAERQLRARGTGELSTAHGHTLRLPLVDNTDNRGDRNNNIRHCKIIVTSPGGDYWPSAVRVTSIEDEQDFVKCIMSEVRDNLAVDMEPEPKVDRWPEVPERSQGADAVKKFLIVGSSHATKLGSALRKTGAQAEVIYQSNWRIKRTSVTDMTERLYNKLEGGHVDAVVYCVWDNSVYYGLTDSGETKPAERDDNGQYHIEGDLITASKSALHAMFSTAKPMFEAAKGKHCIIVTPMPRYLIKSCCEKAHHMPNARLQNFGTQLQRDLKEVSDHFRDFFFTAGFRLFKILDPCISWRGEELGTLWEDDPVHPSKAAYMKMAASALSILTGMESGARKRARTNSIETADPGPRPPLNNSRGDRVSRGGSNGGHGGRGAAGAARGGRRGAH